MEPPSKISKKLLVVIALYSDTFAAQFTAS
jgi:hypothetical protein